METGSFYLDSFWHKRDPSTQQCSKIYDVTSVGAIDVAVYEYTHELQDGKFGLHVFR